MLARVSAGGAEGWLAPIVVNQSQPLGNYLHFLATSWSPTKGCPSSPFCFHGLVNLKTMRVRSATILRTIRGVEFTLFCKAMTEMVVNELRSDKLPRVTRIAREMGATKRKAGSAKTSLPSRVSRRFLDHKFPNCLPFGILAMRLKAIHDSVSSPDAGKFT